MSYRAFKRLLGETDLERKCRFLLGAGILLLMTLSFWAYARQTEGLAYDQMITSGRLLVPPILAREHLSAESREAVDSFQRQSEETWPDALSEYKYKILKPNAKLAEHKPEGDEVSVVSRLAANPELSEESVNQSPQGVFHYYGVIRASEKCVGCHNRNPITSARGAPIKDGEMMAVVKVTLSTRAIETGMHINRALLLSFALMTSLLIMTGSYLIIRYVVVKPVKHLKAVSDAIVGGQLNVRSEIHTGDEFEDLSEAFNRMVRHLMELREEQQKLNHSLQHTNDELARANYFLFESNKTKGDFLSTVSHELRTPLHGIIGFSDVLLSTGSTLSEKQARWVVNIKTSGQQLLTLINDILDLAKIEAGKMDVRPDEFSVPEFCDSMLPGFRIPAEKKSIDLRFHYEPGLKFIRQDAGKVRQILTNLLSNAIKFTPENGRVSLRVTTDIDLVIFTVADTGVGISLEEQEKIFEKFRQVGDDTLTREHEGTGLGLSIVRELCVLLGGEISLKSEPGRGSTFTVRLPKMLAKVLKRVGDQGSRAGEAVA
ncbi:sensor histidine kinase [Zavarzinella formosa]|uniref:sensor histidine kinase n=1 Tax=Zavarzinella formosa TaxID=360055 RepID=UPI0002F0940E|nr:ATP-binding protein [Zavarzinella formosa]